MQAISSIEFLTDEQQARAIRIYNHVHSDDPILDENDPRYSQFSKIQHCVTFGNGRISGSFILDLLKDPKYNDIK